MKKRIILAVIMVIFVTLAAIPGAFAAERMDTRMIAQVNKPGVIFVYSRWTATMVWNEWAVDDSLYSDLNSTMDYLWSAGQVDNSNWWATYISLFIQNMLDYSVYTGGSHTTQGWIGGSGTGFIITPDGYTITNAHVVDMDQKELTQTFSSIYLKNEATKHVKSFSDSWSKSGYTLSDSERAQLFDMIYYIYSLTMEISDISHAHTAYIGNVQPGADVSTKGLQLDIRKLGEADSSKDVAILKLDGSNLPTVALGDDKALKTGDPIFVMGYPGIATTSGVVDKPTAMQEPTMTQGILSAKQIWHDGGSILQYDAATYGGNSGGPVFNEYGEVIGIHTFGLNDKGQRVAGYAYSVPISTLKVYLNELNVTPSESKFTADFKAAINYYNTGKYAEALDLLRGVNETNPGFPVIQELLAEARTAYDANPTPKVEEPVNKPVDTPDVNKKQDKKDSSSSSISILTVILIVAGVLVVGAVIVIIIVASNKKKKAAVPVQPSYAQPYPQMPVQPQYQQFPIQPQQPQLPPMQAPPNFQQPQQPQYIPTVAEIPVTAATQPIILPSSAPAPSVCPRCGSALAPDAKFCDTCGLTLQAIDVHPIQCPQCGAPMLPDAKFCNACGFRMG